VSKPKLKAQVCTCAALVILGCFRSSRTNHSTYRTPCERLLPFLCELRNISTLASHSCSFHFHTNPSSGFGAPVLLIYARSFVSSPPICLRFWNGWVFLFVVSYAERSLMLSPVFPSINRPIVDILAWPGVWLSSLCLSSRKFILLTGFGL
jgi:hypothetical protein